MAARIAARYVARRLSSGGKVLNEVEKVVLNEVEKARENLYIKIKKIEKEKLEKLAHKALIFAEKAPAKPEPSSTDVKSTMQCSMGPLLLFVAWDGISSQNQRKRWLGLAGTTVVCGLGWYLLSKPKKTEEVVYGNRIQAAEPMGK